jgi:thioesterase domain-containing protein/acyl carrier protein
VNCAVRQAPCAKRLPPGRRRQKIYKTGDLVRWLSGGDIEFLGRIDHQVKISGFRIEPGEIASKLRAHAAVNDVIILAKEYKPGDRRLVAYIIFNRGKKIKSRELREFLRQKLPSFMIPSVFIKMDRFPLGSSGKVDYRGLPSPGTAAEVSGKEYKAPRNEVEVKLAQIWIKLLGVQHISITDDFFQLGGYSLLAIRMFYHIEKKLGHKIGVSALFQASTIEKLAEMISNAGAEESSLVLLRPGGSKSPFFFMHHLEGGILDYRELANLVDIEHPVYGIQVKMHEGTPLEYTDIKEAARYYAKVMKTVVKEGPYMLGGHSFGGIVALETARMLIEQEHRVVLLAIIDTRAPGTRWLSKKETRGYYLRTYWERLKFHTSRLSTLKGRKGWQYFLLKTNVVLERLQRRWKRLIRRIKKGQKPVPFNVVGDFKISKLLADSGLISQGYPGKITLFKASISLPLYEREDYGWKKYARDGVEVYKIQGEHGNLLKEPYAVELAEKLNRCIHEAVEGYHGDSFRKNRPV